MSSTRAVLFVLTVALTTGVATFVATAADEEPGVDVTVVYGATRTDAKSTDVAATVQIIDEEDIAASHAENVEDLLRTVPGVEIIQQGSRGGVTSVFMRGANSNQTLVVVDGVRINNPMTGSVDLGNLTLDQIRRIEVVKGPFTTLYGSDAVGGVIYVYTKPGAQVQNNVTVGAGGFGTTTATVSLGGGHGDRGWALSGSWIDTDGTRDVNSDYDGYTVAGRFDTPFAGGVMTFSARYQDYDRGVPGSTFFPTPTDQQDYQTLLGSLTWRREGVSSRDMVRLGAWQEKYNYNYTDFLNNPQFAQADPTYYEASWQHDFLLSNGEVNVGVDWRRFEGDYNDTAMGTYSEDNDSKALYAQVQLRPADAWRFVGGVRLQDDDLFDPDTTWRVGATRLLDDGHAGIWANYGTAFKAPTFNDLFFPGSGNTHLRPETSRSWEVGVWDDIADSGQAQLVYFHNDYDDLIQWAPGAGGIWSPANIGEATTEGVEISVIRRTDEHLTHKFWLSSLDWSTNGAPLLRRPRLQFGYSLGYDDERFGLRIDSMYVDKRRDVVGFTTEQVPAYFVVNLGGDYQINEDTRLWVRVENLFDYDYEAVAGYPSPGFTILSGISRDL
ncbi:MAG: TonB-dependent receptor [Armatimonadetes bacterium]|nr:TonB-dependent receptor [Armatimonadota bacterium]